MMPRARHGLRVSEACGLQLSQVDTESRILHVKRLKDGLSTTHPLRGDELRTIKAWLAGRARMTPDTDAFFISELVARFQEWRCYARWPWWTLRAADGSGAVRKMCGTLRQNVGRYARDRWRFSPHASEVCSPYKYVFSPYTSSG